MQSDTPTGAGYLVKRLFNLHNRMANMDGINNDDLRVILDAYDALEAAERVIAEIDAVKPPERTWHDDGEIYQWIAASCKRLARDWLARHATGQPSGFTPNPHESADDRHNRRISEGLRQDVTGQRKGGDDE